MQYHRSVDYYMYSYSMYNNNNKTTTAARLPYVTQHNKTHPFVWSEISRRVCTRAHKRETVVVAVESGKSSSRCFHNTHLMARQLHSSTEYRENPLGNLSERVWCVILSSPVRVINTSTISVLLFTWYLDLVSIIPAGCVLSAH